MLNFLTKRHISREPIFVATEGEIEANLARVFNLLDFGAPQNALRERGFKFSETPGQSGLATYHAQDPHFDDLDFEFVVDTYVPQRELAYSTRIASKKTPLGNIVHTHSHYVLSPVGEDRCRLKLTETTQLRPGLSVRKYQMEFAALVYTVERHLARLGVHAVKGRAAAELV